MLSQSYKMMDAMLKELSLAISGEERKQLIEYTNLLLEGLKRQRLTGERSAEEIINKQLYDALYPLKLVEICEGSKLLDLGSGGGLPGIPIKICKPEVHMYLLDSNQRKMKFLEDTAQKLMLKNVYYLHGRAEEWGQDNKNREKYDIVFCKAVAETKVLAELALPLTKVGGCVLLYKGPRGRQEVDDAVKAIEICGGEIEQSWNYKLPTGEQRSMYKIKKVTKTSQEYPREVGKPGRKPIK